MAIMDDMDKMLRIHKPSLRERAMTKMREARSKMSRS
jgi:hypothetical protein